MSLLDGEVYVHVSAQWMSNKCISRVGQIRILFLKWVFSMAKLPAEYEYDNEICLWLCFRSVKL